MIERLGSAGELAQATERDRGGEHAVPTCFFPSFEAQRTTQGSDRAATKEIDPVAVL
jgi:hypothetical protein